MNEEKVVHELQETLKDHVHIKMVSNYTGTRFLSRLKAQNQNALFRGLKGHLD